MAVFSRTLIASVLWISGQAGANECLSQMPGGVTPAGQVRLCQSGFTGLKTQYSCQDYRNSGQYYRVIYKGGLEPMAIVRLTAGGKEQLIWSPSFGDPRMRCPLPPPATLPKHARHRGLGLCMDENNARLPCSVYEHTGVRQSRAWRFLVFYNQDGSDSRVAHQMAAGDNQDAMVAELAYQLGLSLLETTCCSEQAAAYLEYAHRLFPRASAYRAGYLQALEQLAVSEQ